MTPDHDSRPAAPAGMRERRRPGRDGALWQPEATGPYRLPRELHDRLAAALAGLRNREAALALAVFLARFWSTPGRLLVAFPIDRRALAEHPALGLTEARVRGALASLEAVGFLDRAAPPAGSRYQATAEGLHRRPILFRFGVEYLPGFQAANARARPAQDGHRRPVAPTAPSTAARLPVGFPAALRLGFRPLAHNHSLYREPLTLGELRAGAAPLTAGPALRAVLDRWRRGG